MIENKTKINDDVVQIFLLFQLSSTRINYKNFYDGNFAQFHRFSFVRYKDSLETSSQVDYANKYALQHFLIKNHMVINPEVSAVILYFQIQKLYDEDCWQANDLAETMWFLSLCQKTCNCEQYRDLQQFEQYK